MPEHKRGSQPKPADPDLLPSQVAFKKLSDEILSHKPDIPLNLYQFRIVTDPAEVLKRLEQSSLKDILLQPGESSTAPQPNNHLPILDSVVGETYATRVRLAHWDWQENKFRIDPDGPQEPPFKVIGYPGEVDWLRQIDIEIWFGEGRNAAAQRLSLFDASRSAGLLPKVTRSVYAPAYAEIGYEGHSFKSRPFRDEAEVMVFVDLARELFEKREPAVSVPKPSSTQS